MTDTSESVVHHSGRHDDLAARILRVLEEAGADLSALTAADLAPLDQFHIRGHLATVELAHYAGLEAETRVLDLGAGIGGPARLLAERFGCRVTGLDLTAAYCRAAKTLTARTGLAGRVDFVCGDGTALPFSDAGFDLVWTQHAAMNIAHKVGLYGETARVLRPGGRLALHDVVAGPVQPIHMPVPWAAKPEWSFLVPAGEVRRLVAAAGLIELDWREVTAEALARSRERRARAAAGEPSLGPQRYLGPEFSQMIKNLGRNLEEDRVGVVQGLFEKPRPADG
jgi:SAM-dependent methyltransferase